MPAFFCKKIVFFVQKGTFTQSNSVRAVLDIFSSDLSFCKIKGYCYWKHNFFWLYIQNLASGLLQIGQKSEKYQWRHNFPTWHHRQFFLTFFVSLVNCSYWSKFHVNIISGSGIMTISFYKGLAWNPEIRNTLVWVLPNIWRLGHITDTKFGTCVSNRILLNAAKCQGYSFYCFWVIKGKPTGVGLNYPTPHHPTQIRVKYFITSWGMIFLA